MKGEYQVGLQAGGVYGTVPEGANFFMFSFEGNDEMDDVSGMGEATLNGDSLTFELRYHYGDEFSFDCERRR